MEIDKKIQEKWNSLWTRGDSVAIANDSKIHYQTIRRAFKENKCSFKVFNAIAKYYKKKEKNLKSILSTN